MSVDPQLVVIPGYLAAIVVERRIVARQQGQGLRRAGFERRDSWASLKMGLVSVATVGLLNVVLFELAQQLWRLRLIDLGTGVVAWVVAMIGWDFAYYWEHRISHERRIFWAAHVNHHSSERYNFTTALRQPWLPLSALLCLPPVVLLGVRPHLLMLAGGFNLIYQFFLHTEAIGRLPRWFEAVFNTPSHHRVHHGSNREYLDRNYGGILIVWDKVFGTFEPERAPVAYGLTKNIHTFVLWEIAWHEYRAVLRDAWRAKGWRTKLAHLFSAPGWTPEPRT